MKPKIEGSWEFASFSQREYQGFRSCREYDKKRIMVSSEAGISVYTYEGGSTRKVTKVIEGGVEELHSSDSPT